MRCKINLFIKFDFSVCLIFYGLVIGRCSADLWSTARVVDLHRVSFSRLILFLEEITRLSAWDITQSDKREGISWT